MRRESQYINDYLNGNDSRGLGKGLTIGTFLAYRLKGRAKNYSDVYERTLLRAVRARGAVSGRSYGGYIAYYTSGDTTQS